ncbi:hypothetical protein KM043_006871 [Ampulex compressa]|nr:hypothetical protein KM043_006871 [Ampulex compressa]
MHIEEPVSHTPLAPCGSDEQQVFAVSSVEDPLDRGSKRIGSPPRRFQGLIRRRIDASRAAGFPAGVARYKSKLKRRLPAFIKRRLEVPLRRLMEFLGDVLGVRANKFTKGRTAASLLAPGEGGGAAALFAPSTSRNGSLLQHSRIVNGGFEGN